MLETSVSTLRISNWNNYVCRKFGNTSQARAANIDQGKRSIITFRTAGIKARLQDGRLAWSIPRENVIISNGQTVVPEVRIPEMLSKPRPNGMATRNQATTSPSR